MADVVYWRRLHQEGRAADRCDEIVATRPVPLRLLVMLAALNSVDRVTVRDLEVMALASHGWRDRNIADALEINVETVRTHWKHIFNATGARRRTGAVGWAIRTGLI